MGVSTYNTNALLFILTIMNKALINFISDTYERMRIASDTGVPGVIKVDDGIAGPCVCISVCTHGNEPSGLYGIGKLLEYLENERVQVRGTLLLILNNLSATAQYISALQTGEPRNSRYIDINMNRLPLDVFTKDAVKYEESRAQELRSTWERISYALDIHSTTLPTEPFIVNPRHELARQIIAGLPIHKIIMNTDTYASGYPAIHFYGTEEKPAQTIGIECGSHEDKCGFAVATESIFTFLSHTNTISVSEAPKHDCYEVYEIRESIYRPNESYKIVKEFANFEFVLKGTELLRGDGAPVVLSEDSHSFFVSPNTDTSLLEEVMFLSRPVVRMKL